MTCKVDTMTKYFLLQLCTKVSMYFTTSKQFSRQPEIDEHYIPRPSSKESCFRFEVFFVVGGRGCDKNLFTSQGVTHRNFSF